LSSTLSELSIDNDIVLVVIDYFRKIEEYDSDGSIAMAQDARSQQLSDLAKLYDCHVLCIFDVTRMGQHNKRIGLEHMKGGTAAQYDADIVLTLNRHELTNTSDTYPREDLLDLTIAKNRFGLSTSLLVGIDRATGHISGVEGRR